MKYQKQKHKSLVLSRKASKKGQQKQAVSSANTMGARTRSSSKAKKNIYTTASHTQVYLLSRSKSPAQNGMANTSREREFLFGKINEPAAATARCNRKNSNRKTKPSIAPNRPLRNGKSVDGGVNYFI